MIADSGASHPMSALLRFMAVSHFPPLEGGSARSCALLFRGAAARGHEVHVLASSTPEYRSYDAEASHLNPPSLSVKRYEVPYFNINQYDINEFLRFQQIEHEGVRQELPRLIDEVRPGFVVCAHETLAGAVIDIAHAKGLPCALMLRGSPTWQIVTNVYPREMAEAYLRLYASADLIIPVGRYMQDGLAARGIGNLRHIPNLLDIQEFSPGPRDESLLDRYGIPRDGVVLLHCSLMQARKRPHDIIESAAIALPKADKLIYLFLGGGEREVELLEAASSRGFGDRVRFIPRVPYEAMPDHIRLADMVALASEGEGIARVYLETQACGRVLVSSDIPAGREVVDHGRTGLLFRTGDPSDLAAQILRAAGDPPLRTRIGEASRKRVQRHDIGSVIDQYLAVFSALR